MSVASGTMAFRWAAVIRFFFAAAVSNAVGPRTALTAATSCFVSDRQADLSGYTRTPESKIERPAAYFAKEKYDGGTSLDNRDDLMFALTHRWAMPVTLLRSWRLATIAGGTEFPPNDW